MLKLKIDKDTYNEEQLEKLKEYIKKENMKTYSLKVEYDDETGLVKNMILTILEKKD